jgi:Calcineurin-like phosphoesterase
VARTIIIGDVHGCAHELARLLDGLAVGADDRVFFVGDLVARGPSSLGVLDIYREVRGRSVLGNHEWRLLEAHRARSSGQRRPRLAAPDYALLHQLREEDWQMLAELPAFILVPEQRLCIVHAGLQPDLAVDVQDVWTLTHTRSIDAAGKPSERHEFDPWALRYRGGPHVVFGHNSRLGLQLLPFATGLDTGCVYGGELSALVLSTQEEVPTDLEQRRQLLRSVPAARRYYAGKSSSPG